MNLLRGRVAIVTGASSGIGAATARVLAAEGAAVMLVARRTERLEALAQQIHTAGGRARSSATDLRDRAGVAGMVRQTKDTFGRVDILVNNAGVMLLAPVRRLKLDEWDRMIDVNVKGLLYCVAAVLPVMLEQREGHLVNIGSVAGRRTFYGGAVYSATKFAVRALSAALREELSPHDRIRVVDIQPGVVDTELGDHVTDQEMRDGFARSWGTKQKLQPEDIARAIVFAVSQPPHVNVNEILVRPTEQET